MAKRGEIVFKNGATANRLPNGRLRIVTGPTKGSKRRNISKRSAKRAFNKYWNKRSAAVKGNKMRSRGVASARGRDILYGSPRNLRKHSGYKQNPGRLDYAGVDYGSRRYNVSAKSLANLRNNSTEYDSEGDVIMKEMAEEPYQQGGAEPEIRTFKNGARAIKLPNGRYKIISGPTKGSKRKKISKRAAQRAFNKYWNARAKAVRGNKLRSRGVASARARDIQYGSPKNLRTHSGYRQNPGRLEYEGVDYGKGRYNVSAKTIASGEEALRIHRAKKNRGRGRQSKVSKITGRKAPAFGMKGSACRNLNEKDCRRHRACTYLQEYTDKNGRKVAAHCSKIAQK